MLTSSSPVPRPEIIHPSLWLASQLARGGARGVSSGFEALDAELPERGWPPGVLIELLLPQEGVGELRLLRPVLARAPATARRPPQAGRIALLQAPHQVNAPGWAHMGVEASRLLQLQADHAADACWAAEQVLRADSCQALLMWQPRLRKGDHDLLRRLHVAAQAGQTLFFMLRPLSCAREPSPAPLRLTLKPARNGLEIGFLKRRGPLREQSLFLPLLPSPNLQRHVTPVDRRTPATAAAGSLPSELAG
ncbi:translesion DNA synthesis-associated protein ImuA [Herbaspirillum huttiense]|uniref:Translesion DNA synthesis-associated protein ImuA n=1 Tax=Herbaspirillum huttiense subsp. lycopersici TaxID=3074428 RepID=A0ABU2EEV7_9BURK|nr:translesion DNA synthesis-associated protein ImuA [Herbaspirillum huttiense]MDR9846671.1 translesion DNA synthesis-associated protein ImuA [Herbaspirillum huttiense SE1]